MSTLKVVNNRLVRRSRRTRRPARRINISESNWENDNASYYRENSLAVEEEVGSITELSNNLDSDDEEVDNIITEESDEEDEDTDLDGFIVYSDDESKFIRGGEEFIPSDNSESESEESIATMEEEVDDDEYPEEMPELEECSE